MNKIQQAKNRLESNLVILKNSLDINLNCREDDIEYNTHYSEKTYTTNFTINYFDRTRSRAYKNFEITGEYFPSLSNFEYNGEKFAFVMTSSEFIKRVQEVLKGLGASW